MLNTPPPPPIVPPVSLMIDFNRLTPMGDQERNFSLQYRYDINQTSEENKGKY